MAHHQRRSDDSQLSEHALAALFHHDRERIGDHTDADAGIVDVPGLRPIVDALAGESGHAANRRGRRADCQVLPSFLPFGIGNRERRRLGYIATRRLHAIFYRSQCVLGFCNKIVCFA
jgi:hypothetical protein